jgi:hypothetical protein
VAGVVDNYFREDLHPWHNSLFKYDIIRKSEYVQQSKDDIKISILIKMSSLAKKWIREKVDPRSGAAVAFVTV